MSPFLLLRIMNRFALVFGAFNLLFALAGHHGGGVTAFLGISAAVWLAEGLRRAFRAPVLVISALIVAWVGARTAPQLIHLGLIVVYALYLAWRGLDLSFEAATDDFHTGLYICLGLLGLALVSFNPGAFERSAAPFILVYLISSAVMLRAAREMEASGRTSSAGRLTSMALVLAAAVLCAPPVRRLVLDGLKTGYQYLLGAVISLLRGFLLAVGMVLAAAIEFLAAIARQRGVRMPPPEQSPSWLEEALKQTGRGSLGRLLDSRYFSLCGHLLVFGLTGLILVRAFRRFRAPRGAEPAGFTEIREKITPGGKAPGARFIGLYRRPADPAQVVRYQYRLFLRLCRKREVDLLPGDTTAEINEKAAAVFARDALAELRLLYIGVRYGGRAAGEEEARKAAGWYRRLRGKGGGDANRSPSPARHKASTNGGRR